MQSYFPSINFPCIKQFLNLVPPDANSCPVRSVELDWLRILLFGLLITHHVGMFYVQDWGWHAKSQYQLAWLDNLLLVVEPWRMPAIWLISGIAIRFILANVSPLRFVLMRSYRLLLPLLFGVLVVVPPQLYIEMTAKSEIVMSYGQFLHALFSNVFSLSQGDVQQSIFANYQHGIWPALDVNHLWYLRSLWYFSLLLVCLLPLLNSAWFESIRQRLVEANGWLTITLLTTPVIAIELWWGNAPSRYPIGLLFLLYGYVLGWQPKVWRQLASQFKTFSTAYAVCWFALIFFYQFVWVQARELGEIPVWIQLVGNTLYGGCRTLGVLMVLAIALRFFNANTFNSTILNSTNKVRKSPLAYGCEAVYPFYILHQTIILVAGFHLTQLNLGVAAESLLLLVITVGGCAIGFEVIKRIDLLRPCFGLKMRGNYSITTQKVGYLASACLLLPLALRLL